MRRARTTDRSMSSVLLLLVALLFVQLCVQGHTGLQGGSGQAAPRGPSVGIPLSVAPAGGQAPAGHDAPVPAAGETATDSTEISHARSGSCPERRAPEQSSSPHLAAPAAAELPSLGGAPALQAARWPAYSEDPPAKAPPPHVSVLRI